jgi:tRNA (cytidine/uridine-2'-O-)-methyltransferase
MGDARTAQPSRAGAHEQQITVPKRPRTLDDLTRDLLASFMRGDKILGDVRPPGFWGNLAHAKAAVRFDLPASINLTMRLALFQPDIPQNTGTILRMAACMGVPVDIIGPTGFDMTDRALRRAGLDYLAHAEISRHLDWEAFEAGRAERPARLILATTHGAMAYTSVAFQPGDTLLFGRESAGAPAHVHAAADLRVCIPIAPALRSLNIAVSAAMILGEALRQTAGFPVLHRSSP